MNWVSVEWGLENISASELAEWKAYFSYHPFKHIQSDFHNSLLCASIFNSHRTSDKQKIFKPDDFILNWDMDKQNIKPTTTTSDDSDTEKQHLQNKANLFRLIMSS